MTGRSCRARGVSLGLFALLLFSPVVLAKGIPTEVEITGPGIATPIRETNPLALPTLGLDGFMETTTTVTPPAGDTLAYEMTRDGGERVRFYPSPGGSCGAVFSIGDPGQIGTEFDNHWYRASPIGDETMRRILAQQGIDLPGNSPGTVAIARRTTGAAGTGATTISAADTAAVLTRTVYPAWPIAILSLGIVVAATGGYALGRKRQA